MKPDLPQPDADALAHSQRVFAHVQNLITQNGGWLALRDYINAVLYAPALGYYVSGTRKISSNTDGSDFVTAPELSPLFARVWTKPIADALTTSAKAHVLELGAGSGAFAAELLRSCAQQNIIIEQYAILERSADLRARQQAKIQHAVPEMVSRVVCLDALPESIEGVVFMNEVLDALAPHVIARRNDDWFEQGVIVENEKLILKEKPLVDPRILETVQTRFPPEGDHIAEINLDAEALVETLARALTAARGKQTLFIVDYGFERGAHLPEHYAAGTLRAYYRHHLLDDIFYLPGLMDITSHVDFVAMLEAAQRGGMMLADFKTQREWLLTHGILDTLQNCGAPDTPEFIAATKAAHALIAPDDMGDIFKVLVLAS